MAEFAAALGRLIDEERPGAKRFPDIVARICNTGTLVHGESAAETELYELAVHLEEELRDFVGVLGCLLFHNPNQRYMRLFPPGAKSPAVASTEGAREDATEGGSTAMRRRGNPHVSALVLALRAVYHQKITIGADLSGAGDITVTLEDVYVTMKAQLNREPAQTIDQRRSALRELCDVWRVIRVPVETDLDDRSTRIQIRPLIADLISESVAQHVEEDARALGASRSDIEEEGESHAAT